VHAVVALRVEVAVRLSLGLLPEIQSLVLLPTEKSNYSLLVEDVHLLSDEGFLHLIEASLEELFVFTD